MATTGTETILRQLRRLEVRAGPPGRTDGQLLEAFLSRRDPDAFEGLLRRHGPMVLGVCRRLLRDPQDTEDAFQATFLVLARKAASVSPRELVGNWLYGVAHTTAVRLRAANAKRRLREKQVADMPEPPASPRDLQDDVQPVLDEELARLPDRLRVPIVLCDLEGRSRKDVARQLRIPEGTLSSRLTTARRTLAKRLTRRGVMVSGGALALVVARQASARVPTSLVGSTLRAATLAAAGQAAAGVNSARIAALVEGVVKTMFLTKLKRVVAVLLGIVALGGAAGLIHQVQAVEPPGARKTAETASRDKHSDIGRDDKPRSDLERLQGSWRIVSSVDDGDRAGKTGEEWTFKATTLKVVSPATRDGGATTSYLRFRLDEAASPKRIVLAEGTAHDLFDPAAFDKLLADPARRDEGIYSLAGDTLRLCVSRRQGERPTAFASKPGSDSMLLVLRRRSTRQEGELAPAGREGSTVRVATAREASKYKGLFVKMLGVVAEHFEEITHASQYEGRIEARSVADAKGTAVVRKVVVQFLEGDDGNLTITVSVQKIATAGDRSRVVGHDAELEQTILGGLDVKKGPKDSPSAAAPGGTSAGR